MASSFDCWLPTRQHRSHPKHGVVSYSYLDCALILSYKMLGFYGPTFYFLLILVTKTTKSFSKVSLQIYFVTYYLISTLEIFPLHFEFHQRMTSLSMDTCHRLTPRPLEIFRFRYVSLSSILKMLLLSEAWHDFYKRPYCTVACIYVKKCIAQVVVQFCTPTDT